MKCCARILGNTGQLEHEIMKAKRKQLDEYEIDDFDIDDGLKVETVGWSMPSERQAGIIVDSVDALLEKLANEAKVI